MASEGIVRFGFLLFRFFAFVELLQEVEGFGFLGVEFERAWPNNLVIRLPYAHHLRANDRGPEVDVAVMTTLLDHASGMSVRLAYDGPVNGTATIDLRIDVVDYLHR